MTRRSTAMSMPMVEPSGASHGLAGPGHERTDAHGSYARSSAGLLIWADALDDLERARIAVDNRLRALAQDKHVPVDVAGLEALRDATAELEHRAELGLKRALRQHPLGAWVKATHGIGEKQAARALAAIGDPGERHTVSGLWHYCGFHVVPFEGPADHASPDAHIRPVGVAPRPVRGQQLGYNPIARMRVFLMAEACMKHRGSPYRAVYDAGRAKYAESVHAAPCRRCGPRGKPAAPGTPLSAGHQHARALRLVAKAILRDMWVEARKAAR